MGKEKQVTISDAGISVIVRAVTRLTRLDVKGSPLQIVVVVIVVIYATTVRTGQEKTRLRAPTVA